MNIVIGIALYFALGLIVLVIFDLITKRIRMQIKSASYDAMNKLASSGTVVGSKASLVLISIAMWVFWWVVLIGAFGGKNGEKE